MFRPTGRGVHLVSLPKPRTDRRENAGRRLRRHVLAHSRRLVARVRAGAAAGPLHLAIRVAPETFTSAIGRLSESGTAFGNDPEDAANGRTDDQLGGTGRAYFRDPDGHFYELVAAPAPG
jgi:catechol 2,3-dioxygenase-like lactoylglutathione lyase family enzyme